MQEEYRIIFDNHMSVLKKQEPIITSNLTNIVEFFGGKLVCLDTKFKSFESTFRKLKDIVSLEKISSNANEAEIFKNSLVSLKDLLRYTVVIKTNGFGFKTQNILNDLVKLNYNLITLKNRFYNDTYKDVLIHLAANINDFSESRKFIFEIQFHTEKTLKYKNISHYLYEITRQYQEDLNNFNPIITDKINMTLKELYKDVKIPKDINLLKDFSI